MIHKQYKNKDKIKEYDFRLGVTNDLKNKKKLYSKNFINSQGI